MMKSFSAIPDFVESSYPYYYLVQTKLGPRYQIDASTRLNRGGCSFSSIPPMGALSNIKHIKHKPVLDLVSRIHRLAKTDIQREALSFY
jgi:hypothetical protein